MAEGTIDTAAEVINVRRDKRCFMATSSCKSCTAVLFLKAIYRQENVFSRLPLESIAPLVWCLDCSCIGQSQEDLHATRSGICGNQIRTQSLHANAACVKGRAQTAQAKHADPGNDESCVLPIQPL